MPYASRTSETRRIVSRDSDSLWSDFEGPASRPACSTRRAIAWHVFSPEDSSGWPVSSAGSGALRRPLKTQSMTVTGRSERSRQSSRGDSLTPFTAEDEQVGLIRHTTHYQCSRRHWSAADVRALAAGQADEAWMCAFGIDSESMASPARLRSPSDPEACERRSGS